ncbi:MAG: recombinase family protein [Alphaproteobacteria bacterium]
MNEPEALPKRCAIYTRTSSEDGLAQEFNSLDAQRGACAAYILSQRAEGWTFSGLSYEDGGYSGAAMDRPELERLLADLDAGRFDVVVVYKVDRLTRSLADFARMMERFERCKASFVSVTQSFSTTSSVGRLTLNILLSFAQFEREMTRERIRDKIAASKAKGMWMGGNPPLGYDVRDRKLQVNKHEADAVSKIFELSLILQTPELIAELDRLGIRSKRWTSGAGRIIGGCKLVQGAIRHILRNRTYIGEVLYKGQIYRGQHCGIISPELFERVQAELGRRSDKVRTGPWRNNGAPLSGLVFDRDGNRLYVRRTRVRRTSRYRYYTTRGLEPSDATRKDSCVRVRADVLDAAARQCVAQMLGEPNEIEVSWHRVRECIARVAVTRTSACFRLRIGQNSENRSEAIQRVSSLGKAEMRDGFLELVSPLRLAREKSASTIINHCGEVIEPFCYSPRRESLSLMGLAHVWRKRMLKEGHKALKDVARARALSVERVSQIVELAYLAPDIQRTVLERGSTAEQEAKLMAARQIPFSWAEQREMLNVVRDTA